MAITDQIETDKYHYPILINQSPAGLKMNTENRWAKRQRPFRNHSAQSDCFIAPGNKQKSPGCCSIYLGILNTLRT